MGERPLGKVRRKGEAFLAGFEGWFQGNRMASGPEVPSNHMVGAADAGAPISIRDLMTLEPVTVRLDTPLHGALELLIQKDLSALPVVDENHEIVGLLNERHVLVAVGDPTRTTISEVMDPEPVTVEIEEPIVELVDRLMVINVRQVLVLENSKLVGVVTRADLMPAVHEILRQRADGDSRTVQ